MIRYQFIWQSWSAFDHGIWLRRFITQFDEFIEHFIGNLNVRHSNRTWLSALQPPPQLWTFSKGNTYTGQEKITQINVYQVTSFYDEEQYLEINELVRQIDIPDPPPLS